MSDRLGIEGCMLECYTDRLLNLELLKLFFHGKSCRLKERKWGSLCLHVDLGRGSVHFTNKPKSSTTEVRVVSMTKSVKTIHEWLMHLESRLNFRFEKVRCKEIFFFDKNKKQVEACRNYYDKIVHSKLTSQL